MKSSKTANTNLKRTCFICGESFPQTRQFFYDSTKYMNDGKPRKWSSYCIKCSSMYGVLAYRKKRLWRGFDGYLMQPLDNIEHVRRYLNEPKLPCLLCGKRYSSLGIHLNKGHNILPRDYKKIFNIPLTYSLSGREYKNRKRKLPYLYTDNRTKILDDARVKAKKKSLGRSGKHPDDTPESSKESLRNNYKKRLSKGRIARRKSAANKIEVHCSLCKTPLTRTVAGLKSLENQGLEVTCPSCSFQKHYEKQSALNIKPKTTVRGISFEDDIIKFLDSHPAPRHPSKLISDIIRSSTEYINFLKKAEHYD